jgi:hypothetical protein
MLVFKQMFTFFKVRYSINLHLQWSLVCGLYYKQVKIINYASSGVNKLKAALNDDARVVIYDHHMFIVQATGG